MHLLILLSTIGNDFKETSGLVVIKSFLVWQNELCKQPALV